MRRFFYTAAVATFILLSGPDVLAQQLTSVCPEDGEAQHWDKIIFEVKLAKKQSPVIPPEFLGVTLDLKILDPPETILNLDQEVRNAVADRFNLGDFDAERLKIKIIDVKYQIVTCAFTGPQGQQGVPGPQGPPGLSGLERVQENSPFDFVATKQVIALCPAGKMVVGGGYLFFFGGPTVPIRTNVPVLDLNAWLVSGTNFGGEDWGVSAIAICAEVSS
jgi:hypothetical protein